MTLRPFLKPLSASVALLVAATTCGVTPSFASTGVESQQIFAAVSEAAPVELDSIPAERSDGHLTSSFSDGGASEIAIDPVAGISFTDVSGETGATMTIPGADALADAVVSEDGSVTFAGTSQVPSVNVMVAEGVVRVSAVIESAAQTDSFDYDFGAGTTVEIQEDGSALVLRAGEMSEAGIAEEIVADLDAPWARDAEGTTIPTRYEARGGVLRQVVEHQDAGAVYPVVADPSYDQPNIIQHRIRFNRAETKTIAGGGWGGAIGAISCGVMAPVCAVASGVLVYNAGVAENSKPKRCLQVTATSPGIVPGIVWWVDTYRGGNCR